MSAAISAVRPEPDQVMVDIADYVSRFPIASDEAYATAHYCLLDTLGCGFEALSYPACTKLLGPITPGTIVPNGAGPRPWRKQCDGAISSLLPAVPRHSCRSPRVRSRVSACAALAC